MIALVKGGRSLSGHERNCCFLNLQQGKFANISVVSGVDFPDDGRAIGVADFDLDGDLDLWMVNRSGPQVRLLRNDSPPGHHYVALKLEGVKCNRDAIGARVEVRLRGDTHAPLMKTLRAGESFLSQSSKWLQFGLGTYTEIENVTVRWPGGAAEEFRGLQADRRYRLVQGSGQAPSWEPPPQVASRTPLQPSTLEAPKSTPHRCFLGKRFPLPKLVYQPFSGSATPIAAPQGQPMLLVLWASWCGPCLEELQGLQASQAELSAAGLHVLALSVDGLTDDRTNRDDAKAFLQRQGFSLPAGMATGKLVDTLQLFMDAVFVRDVPIAIPYSFLVDSQGQLAAVYRGAVDIPQVLADQKKLSLTGQELRHAGLPFAGGRWINMPDYDSLLRITGMLLEENLDEELEYVTAVQERLRKAPGYTHFVTYLIERLLGRRRFDQAETWCHEAVKVNPKSGAAHHLMGIAHFNRNRHADAVASFRRAAELSPNTLTALKTLTWVLATSPDPKIHSGPEAVDFAKRMFRAVKVPDPSMFDVAAAAYARAGRYEDAIKVLDQGIDRAREARGVQVQMLLEARRELYKQHKPLTQTGLPESSSETEEPK